MEDQDQESDFEESKILQLISDASSNEESVRQQATQFLQSCTYKLQLLPAFESILQKCIETKSQSNIYYCLLILRDIIINRGCLLPPDKHMAHIEHLFTIAENVVELISDDIAILNVFSDAVAYSYRFIFESENIPPKIVFDFFESSKKHGIIAMSILVSILNVIEKEMPHLSSQNHDGKRKLFKNNLPNFFTYSFRCITTSTSKDDDPQLIKRINILGIELFNKTAEIHFYGTSDSLHINIEYFKSEESKDCPQSFFFIDSFYNLFNELDPQNAIKAGRCIVTYIKLCKLFSKAPKGSKKIKEYIFNSMLYVIYNTNQILPGLTDSPENENFVQEGYDKRDITPILSNIANSMEFLLSKNELYVPAFKFVHEGVEIEGRKGSGIAIIFDFIGSVVNYTKKFLLIDPNEFFTFWKIIICLKWDEPTFEKTNEIAKDIFKFYYDYLLEINENLEQRAEEFFGYSNSCDFDGNVWEMMKGSIVDVAELISETIHQMIEDEKDKPLDSSFEAAYQQLIIIVTLFTSLISNYSKIEKVFADNINDLERAFNIIFLSIIDFILFQSGNLGDRLNIIGEYVAKAELCFAALFRSFYLLSENKRNNSQFNSNKSSIEKKIEIPYKEKKIQNFFIDHFVDVIKIFTPFTDLIIFILDTLDEIQNRDYLSGNEKLTEASKERLQPFDLETVQFVYLKKVIPKMYKIYSCVVDTREWEIFLSSFDDQFSDELNSPPKCFLLFSQLYGVLMYADKKKDLIPKFFEWMLENHFEDTIRCLQIHCKDQVIVTMIVKFWRKISAINGPYKIFSVENGNGILYFRSNERILSVLKDCCEDSQWISMKLIHNCIIGDYANYGIMELFQDDSLEKVLDSFFYLLNWAIGERSKRLILITQIIAKLPEIEITEKILLNVEDNINCALEFLIQNLLITNEEEIVKKNLWIETCRCLYKIMVYAIKKSFPISKFSQFYIVLLDALITLPFDKNDDLLNNTSKVLYLFMFFSRKFCENVAGAIIQTFEEEYKDIVKGIFDDLWNGIPLGEEDDPQKADDFIMPKDFDLIVQTFSIDMKRYNVELANIEIFQGIFRRSE